MAKQTVNIGTTANDRTGDNLRTAFNKINENFTELYTALGLDEAPLNLGAFEFTGSIITTTDSSAVVIDQATTVSSDLTVGGDVVPGTAAGGDLGSLERPWKSLYVSNSTIYLGGTALAVNQSGQLTVNGSTVSGGSTDISDLTDRENLLSVASNIESESDVEIRVNLTDSTTRIWRFGEDGDLTFPDSTVQETAFKINPSNTLTTTVAAAGTDWGEGDVISISNDLSTEIVTISNSLGEQGRAYLPTTGPAGKQVVVHAAQGAPNSILVDYNSTSGGNGNVATNPSLMFIRIASGWFLVNP